jgi:SAM-dependent methyltransferase
MRDVVTGFYCGVLGQLIASGKVSTSDTVLVVCGGPLDAKVMKQVGFANVLVTNLDRAEAQQDVERLTYADKSFDVVVVHAGLHHCFSPHRALLEMYRVARKAVIAFESRDSLTMRTAVRLGLTLDYETDSITPDGKGGVAETGIPNFVYRWTERDVIKTIASFDPTREPNVEFFYDLRIPFHRLGAISRHLGVLLDPLSKGFAAIFPSQCNEFAFAISKSGKVHPWIV